jgi:hypothetical protein
MPPTEMIVMIAAFTALALSFIHVLRLVGTWIVHRTIRTVADKDPVAVQPLLEQFLAPKVASGDDRLSVILISVGVAMLLASLIVGGPDVVHYGAAAAVFPLVVGTALWLRLFFLARSERRGAGQ